MLIVIVDEEDVLVHHLRYDGNYNLAVCIECQHALPMEWIKTHFKDSHKIKVSNQFLYSLIYTVYGRTIGMAGRVAVGE